jgi:uncharacterized membrane protein
MKKPNAPFLIGLFALILSLLLNRFCESSVADFFSGFCTGIGVVAILYGLWLMLRKAKSKK